MQMDCHLSDKPLEKLVCVIFFRKWFKQFIKIYRVVLLIKGNTSGYFQVEWVKDK